MAVPFALGKVLDFIYSSDKDKMRQNLNNLAALLFVVFLIGGACNFGRVYLMNISGRILLFLISPFHSNEMFGFKLYVS